MSMSLLHGSHARRQRATPYRALTLLSQPGAQLVVIGEEAGALIVVGKRSTRVNQATLDLLREQGWIEEQPVTILEGSLSSPGLALVQQLEASRRGYTQLSLPGVSPT